MAWLTNWNRRKSKIINGLSTDSTNIMVNLTVFKGTGTDTADTIYCNNNVKGDFSDIRFTKSDGTTQLRYRILSSVPDVSANVIAEIDFLPASQPTQIYIYYDNPAALDAQTPTLSPNSIIGSNNLNDAIPNIGTPFAFTCTPRFDTIYTHVIPSTFDEAWVAIQGLTNYPDIINDVNGVIANDLYVLDINGVFVFNLPLTGTTNTCFTITARSPKSVNITDTLSPLKGQSVNFRVRLVDSQGTGFSASSGAVYFVSAPIPVTNLGAWGTEEVAAQNIIAISITPSRTTCTEPCNLTVDITWRNDGSVTGTFEPAIMVDGVRTATLPESLAPGVTTTATFSVTGLTIGSHTICSDPDTLPCVTINVLSPSNIVATDIVPSTTACTEPCNLTVDITWRNDGDIPGTFAPTIVVDNVPTTLPNATLDPLQTLTRTFSVTGLMRGSHTICANPNTLPCVTINVLAPANIISTSITPSATTCREPCDITIDVTWTNTGGVSGNFEPAILTNGVRTALPNVTLDPLQTVTRTFTLTGLTQGSYTICADPDTGTACAIVTVEKVVGAGMGALLVGGLALGFLLFAGRKKEKEEEKIKKV